jgi:hypothetical protein
MEGHRWGWQHLSPRLRRRCRTTRVGRSADRLAAIACRDPTGADRHSTPRRQRDKRSHAQGRTAPNVLAIYEIPRTVFMVPVAFVTRHRPRIVAGRFSRAMPHPDSAIQDPYLGREALFLFDSLISGAMAVNQGVAARTHGRQLTRLQRAACHIIPNGFSIALSIRELVRTGYLFSAEILLRPLIERVAVISYLVETGSEALDLWERGWPHATRPPLSKLLGSIKEYSEFDQQSNSGIRLHAIVRHMTKHFNSIIHADPEGLDTNIGVTISGSVGYLSGASVRDPEKCDHIVIKQLLIYLSMKGPLIFIRGYKFPRGEGHLQLQAIEG